ncbi:hypothetical protein DBW_2266 [Desulfuromonas sp. DDH964]|uniref:hypothetical protein n=1 Tax=Desulfuromonas sp. DDH964 TaxID=1823759 RepID=UPI00078C42D0|nr:hypothetical protein [Desulfuromonas sp. DDH964]AMV72605.1 hypothetical protein DBW_2266 [Desulfuromonas sp. DDH964]
MKNSESQFEMFRYQLLPIDRYLQGDLFEDISTVEDLLKKKNNLFSRVLSSKKDFSNKKTQTATKLLLNTEDFFLFRIAANRSLHRETKEFKEEYLDNWPSILVAVWNDPEVQIVAVQKRTSAFQHTETVVKLILDGIRSSLAGYHLRAIHEPMVERKVFWQIVEKYYNKIQKIEFEFITPNMANISGNLPESLKEFAKAANSVKNKLEIEADPDSSLHIEKNNNTISSLADYTSDGGGNVALKVRGLSKKINTSKTIKHVEVSELSLQGTAEEVAEILKELMK